MATAALLGAGLATGGALSATAAAAAPSVYSGITKPNSQVEYTPGRYIVTLADNAAATYSGGVTGLAPTQPTKGQRLDSSRKAVESYVDYLKGKQRSVASDVGVKIDYSYTLALNGFSSTLTAAQAAQLAANKGVVSIEKDTLRHVSAEPSTDFLGLSGPEGVWAKAGGIDKAGKGVVLGVLDTGVAPENPSFRGSPLGTTAGDAPYYSAPGVTSFAKSDGNTFTGVCQTGAQFTVNDCSTKIIGARYFVDGFGASKIGTPATGEYLSPRDGDGHGSHTASTAVGNADVPTTIAGQSFGPITGVAPAAKVAVYKVCWEGPDPSVTTDDGCTTSDIVAATDAAVADGVDALNFSIGGSAAQTTVSASDQAFLGAAAAGVFVAAAGGNAGPGPSTLDNASPWYTTVAASTIPSYEGTVVLGNGEKYAGASITVDRSAGVTPLTGSLITATAAALPGAAQANLCVAGTLDPATVAGKIVVCERGVSDRISKSAEVKRAGGIGMVLLNVTPGDVDLDLHSLPSIHLDQPFHDAVLAYAATSGATATFLPTNTTPVVQPVPQVAGFSSRGPVLADGSDIIKPDITAPGVSILAATANAAGGEPTYAFYSGTSMATPHIAGLAVLYFGVHPLATPAEIKSAMMTTAYNTVDVAGKSVTDPFVQGSGHVDPTKYFSPGLLYLNGIGDWLSYIEGAGYDVADPSVHAVDPSDLNLASIGIGSLTGSKTVTRTVTSTQAGTFTATVSGLAGVTTKVEPSTLTFGAAGESKSYSVTFTRTTATLNTFATGALDWTSGTTVAHSTVAVQPVPLVAPAGASGTGVTGSTPITVTPGSTGPVLLTSTGLTKGVLQPDPSGTAVGHSGSGVSGDQLEYTVTVPAGTSFARFDLNSLDDTADLDLLVNLLDANGQPVLGYSSATGSADERVNIKDPEPGTYQVLVDFFSAPATTAFDLTTFAVAPGGASLTLAPSTLEGTQGVEATYTASWTDLEPFSQYLGVIGYAKTGVSTVLEVTTQALPPKPPVNTEPPTISGNPSVGKTLTASPGTWSISGVTFTYQWLSNGAPISGATTATYVVKPADQGAALAVQVTASGAGLPSASATSATVSVRYTTLTTLSLSRTLLFSWQKETAMVMVSSGAPSSPTGSVVVTIDGKVRTTVPLTAAQAGKVSVTLPKLGQGFHVVKIAFLPNSPMFTSSLSNASYAFVLF